MKISVIVPAYRAEQWVVPCLESLARQTHRDLEIILVYDSAGEGDRTAEIAEQYSGVIIIRGNNGGLSVARNVGLGRATGDYVHFLDIDDSVNERFYELLAAAAEAANADAAACEVINEPHPRRNTLIAEARVLGTTAEKMRGTNVGRWGYVWRYIFRRTLLLDHSLQFEPGRVSEDLPFSLAAIYFANHVTMVPGAVYTYRQHPERSSACPDRAWRKRKHRDMRHARVLRHKFARRHGFTMPGVTTRLGFLSLWYEKWLT